MPDVTHTRVLTCSLQAHYIRLITHPLTAACRPQTTWVESYKEDRVTLLDLISWFSATAAKGNFTRVLPGVFHTWAVSCTLLPRSVSKRPGRLGPCRGAGLGKGVACFLGNIICYLRLKGELCTPRERDIHVLTPQPQDVTSFGSRAWSWK